MLKLTAEGYIYESENSIRYEILEGVGIGGNQTRKITSDIIFIMTMDDSLNVENPIIGYLYGASCFMENPADYEESIADLVKQWETENL